MPILREIQELEINPEKFLSNCSVLELREVEILLYSKRFQDKMYNPIQMATEALTQNNDEHISKVAFIS